MGAEVSRAHGAARVLPQAGAAVGSHEHPAGSECYVGSRNKYTTPLTVDTNGSHLAASLLAFKPRTVKRKDFCLLQARSQGLRPQTTPFDILIFHTRKTLATGAPQTRSCVLRSRAVSSMASSSEIARRVASISASRAAGVSPAGTASPASAPT